MPEWFSEIGRTIGEQFSDLASGRHATEAVIRLLFAALLGGALGYDRERKGKAAGTRTHMLIAVGSALFVLVPLQAGMATADLSRVLQGVAAGIGFLGAGTILKSKDEGHIQGLTTSAGIWLTAAVGMTAGMGRLATASLVTALAVAILSLIPKVHSNGATTPR